ncbi:MAG: hypothetical protein A2176_04460 [Spirochaetes bacterium RBG_13_51_14]|nr:MAG: hypothetical protein A2176_04460 [Spirochaetes bacterium RBG_13_51_14]
MAEIGFNFKKLIDDSKSVLAGPKEYFTSMPKKGGFVEPIIKAVIYGAVAGVLGMIWSIIGLSAVGRGMFGIGGGMGIMVLVGALIASIIGLFIGAVIILILSAICGGSTDFEANTRVSASLMVMYPISSLFGFAGGIHFSVGAVISLLVSLYGVYLLYNALVYALGGKEGTAKIVSIVIAAIPVLMLVSALVCARGITSTSEHWMRKSEQMVNEMEKNKKSTEDAMEKLEDLRKKLDAAAEKDQK